MPDESSQAKDPKRKLLSAGSQGNEPHMISDTHTHDGRNVELRTAADMQMRRDVRRAMRGMIAQGGITEKTAKGLPSPEELTKTTKNNEYWAFSCGPIFSLRGLLSVMHFQETCVYL